MKQKLYALDAFFIEKLKLSENDPYAVLNRVKWIATYICSEIEQNRESIKGFLKLKSEKSRQARKFYLNNMSR